MTGHRAHPSVEAHRLPQQPDVPQIDVAAIEGQHFVDLVHQHLQSRLDPQHVDAFDHVVRNGPSRIESLAQHVSQITAIRFDNVLLPIRYFSRFHRTDKLFPCDRPSNLLGPPLHNHVRLDRLGHRGDVFANLSGIDDSHLAFPYFHRRLRHVHVNQGRKRLHGRFYLVRHNTLLHHLRLVQQKHPRLPRRSLVRHHLHQHMQLVDVRVKVVGQVPTHHQLVQLRVHQRLRHLLRQPLMLNR